MKSASCLSNCRSSCSACCRSRKLRPLGSLQRIKIDVRIVAATNRDLQKEVAAGRFREDLFHRLNVVRLTLPPLRERKEDIPLLIERFLSQPNGRFTLSYDATEAMMAVRLAGQYPGADELP